MSLFRPLGHEPIPAPSCTDRLASSLWDGGLPPSGWRTFLSGEAEGGERALWGGRSPGHWGSPRRSPKHGPLTFTKFRAEEHLPVTSAKKMERGEGRNQFSWERPSTPGSAVAGQGAYRLAMFEGQRRQGKQRPRNRVNGRKSQCEDVHEHGMQTCSREERRQKAPRAPGVCGASVYAILNGIRCVAEAEQHLGSVKTRPRAASLRGLPPADAVHV